MLFSFHANVGERIAPARCDDRGRGTFIFCLLILVRRLGERLATRSCRRAR
jgi:hypothetical protein